jgi:O-glycosyl hydrolase
MKSVVRQYSDISYAILSEAKNPYCNEHACVFITFEKDVINSEAKCRSEAETCEAHPGEIKLINQY